MLLNLEKLNILACEQKSLCVFLDDNYFYSLLCQLNPNSIKNYSPRSFYYWKRKEKPIPVPFLVKFCKKHNLCSLNVTSLSVNSGNKINLPQEEILEFYYFLGLLLGDGCLSISEKRGYKRKSYTLQISTNKKSLIELGALTTRLFNVKYSCYKGDGCYNLCVFSKALVLLLNSYYEIPVGKKYSSIKVPKKVKQNKERFRYFLKGMFDSDGNLYFHKNKLCFQLRQKSYSFLKEIYNLMVWIGLEVKKPYYDKANNSWVIWCSKRSVVDKFINEIMVLYSIHGPVA